MNLVNIPKISIITPSFNQGLYLEDCIKSIIDQEYSNLEFIVLDGGSTDLSKFILRKYSKHFTYWRSECDSGQYHAIQEGINLSTGEIIGWLNSDDILHPGALWYIANAYKTDPSSLWFSGIPTAWNKSGELTYINPAPPEWSYDYFTNILKMASPIFLQQESTFFTKKIWEMAGGRIETRYKLAADFELWLRFSRYSKVKQLNALIGGFRRHEQQKTANQYETYLSEVVEILRIETGETNSIGKQNHCSVLSQTGLPIATSLAPKDLINQSNAIKTWVDNGFIVHSFNSRDEIVRLEKLYTNVVFHEVSETAVAIVGKPMVYLKDIFKYFYEKRSAFTLSNSDIHFSVGRGLSSKLAYHLESYLPRVIAASRVEIEDEFAQLNPYDQYNAICRLKGGRRYFMGLDQFSFNLASLDIIYPLIETSGGTYSLGIPWWDYWLPMTVLSQGIDILYLMPTPIFHFYHEAQYSKEIWRAYGKKYCSDLHLIKDEVLDEFPKDPDQLDQYLNNICAQTIRFIGHNFIELDLGTYLRVPKKDVSGRYDFVSYKQYHFTWQGQHDMLEESVAVKNLAIMNLERAIGKLALPQSRSLAPLINSKESNPC